MISKSEPTASPAVRAARARSLPTPGARRATVIGAGSFGTALAVLLSRGGLRTTLQARTAEQAARLEEEHENRAYLPGVELPASLRIEAASAGVARADYVFLAVPSSGLGEVIATLGAAGLGKRTAVVSVAKGLVPPAGLPPTIVLSRALRRPAGRVHRRTGTRPGDGQRGRRPGGRLQRRGARAFAGAGVHARRSRLRAVQRPPRRRAGRRRQERRGAGGGRHRGAGPERRGGGRRAHLRRGVALRRELSARDRSR